MSPPRKKISRVSHGLVSPLPTKLIITRSIGAKLRAIALLPAAPCSAAGGHEFAKLRGHGTRPRTQCVSALTHSHGIAEIRETKMRKQLYLFSADPAAAKGAPLKSNLVFRWVNLWLLDVEFCLSDSVLFNLFIFIIKETELYPERRERWIECLTEN